MGGTATEAGAPTQQRPPIFLPRGDGQTVLVIEGDDSIGMLVVDVIMVLGYRVIETVDGSQALPVIEGVERIDLLVAEIGLPGLNGRQIAKIAVDARPGLKVLFITG